MITRTFRIHVGSTSLDDIDKVVAALPGVTITDRENRQGACGYTTITIVQER